MSKDFTEIAFNPVQLKEELDRFRELLTSGKSLGERELQKLFKASLQLTANIGTAVRVGTGVARQVACEFEIMGDYAADLVLGNRGQRFCLVELESGAPDAVLERVGKKATKEWSRSFEHGFSQLVDWFCHLDDFKKTERFHRNFGYGHIDFVGLLLIGRNGGLQPDDVRRLRWRTHHVVVNSHHVLCMTYDELYMELSEVYEQYSTAFKIEASPPPAASAAAAPDGPTKGGDESGNPPSAKGTAK